MFGALAIESSVREVPEFNILYWNFPPVIPRTSLQCLKHPALLIHLRSVS